MKARSIPLKQLLAHPKRDNHCPPETQAKIQRHIQRTGNYEPLVVYSDPAFPNAYTIINGHVRFEIAKALGWNKIDCYLWDITPAEAELALATLNTLKGNPDPDRRMTLLASLQALFPVEELQLLLPESVEALEDMRTLQALDQEKAEAAFQEALAAERKELPVTLTFVVLPEEKTVIDEALKRFEDQDRSGALVSLCKAWMGEPDDESN